MNCATIQQKQPQEQQKLTSNYTAATTTKTLTSAPVTSSSPLATATLSNTQNCSKNCSEQENSKLMIKNIETSSSNRTEWDEKEKENISLLQRRESVPEDSIEVENNTKPENFENNNSSVSSQLSVKPKNYDSPAVPIIEAPADTANVVSTSDANVVDAPLAAESQSKSATVNCSLIENLEQSSATAINNQIADKTNNTCGSTKQLNRTPSPSLSPQRKSSTNAKGVIKRTPSDAKLTSDSQCSLVANSGKVDEDSISKSSDTSGELIRGSILRDSSVEKSKSSSRLSERAKKKSWYNVLYPNYKSRSQDFKKLFGEVPSDERLIVDYSCALQRDILVHGRLYVSQNYVCFHANIFRWETYLIIKWKDVTAITKEKTALVIPNAISICTANEKHFFATFATRDKTFLMLFRVWQNTLMNRQMLPQEMWQWVHNCYGDELGLTTDDEDYIDPTSVKHETEADESDLDFVSAIDDSCSLITEREIDLNEESTADNFDCDESYKQFSIHFSSSGAVSLTNSTTCKSSNNYKNNNIRKSTKKSNSSSSTTTTSGSDNKTSDNNSSADSNSSKSKMKSNAKELTLISAKPTSTPDEAGSGAGSSNSAKSMNGDGSGGGGGVASNTPAKESKSATSTVSNASSTFEGKRKVPKNNRQRDECSNKNSEALPTDVSDSSDSDENKIPFVATAECNSTHEGRQLMHTILPINIETLFNLLFSKSKFFVDFHAMRKSTDTCFGDWTTNEEGQKTRTVNLTVQIAASVGPKASKVTEYQVIRDCSKPGELYSVDVNSENAGIPYADSFSVLIHYCLVRTVDDHTMLSVHAQIKYKKSIWGVVKGFIEKNTWAGLEDFYTALLHSLQSETNIPPAKGKGRRPRRGTAAQVRPLEELLPAIQLKPDTTTEKVLATHALTPKHQTANKVIPIGNTRNYKWLSLFVVVLCLLLILLNVILLVKIWKMEGRIEEEYLSRTRMPNLAAMKQLPNTPQDWIDLVRQQEILHEAELKKWHKVLQAAVELLKKTEKTLAELMFR